jgi:hypothetical protein
VSDDENFKSNNEKNNNYSDDNDDDDLKLYSVELEDGWCIINWKVFRKKPP